MTLPLFTWAAEKARQRAARAYRIASHGQRTRTRRAFERATAEALKVEN